MTDRYEQLEGVLAPDGWRYWWDERWDGWVAQDIDGSIWNLKPLTRARMDNRKARIESGRWEP